MASIPTFNSSPLPQNVAPAAPVGSAGKNRTQLQHAAGEFESILLGQWLQGAEDSFGTVPGSDDDHDAADDQMKNFGVQALAKAFTQAGGIGISSMVSKALAHSGSAISDPAKATGVL